MSEPVSLASLFDAAEQAAVGGDFVTASRLLSEAARAQEAALGPDHLDLANTLNNLAVAHERCGQLDAAEREYRRAHAIAARTLPADDPLVTTSAQNLREFCQANGRPVDVPPSVMSLAPDSSDPVTIVLNKTPAMAASTQADVPTQRIEPLPMTLAMEPPAPATRRDQRPPAAAPRPKRAESKPAPPPAPLPASAPASRPTPVMPAARATAAAPAAPGRRMSIPVLVAIGAVAALVIWLLAGRGPASPPAETTAAAADTPSVAPSPTPAAPRAAAPVTPPSAAPAPAPGTSPGRPVTAAASADGVTIGDAQLCTSLSSSYRCDAAGSTVRPGRLVFYTRLVADHNTSVVHRWYRGNELRQSMRLEVPARRQGFRTFSRATVTASEGEWRVELRTRDGQVLHTERFTVR
jgi:hypothetical protein